MFYFFKKRCQLHNRHTSDYQLQIEQLNEKLTSDHEKLSKHKQLLEQQNNQIKEQNAELEIHRNDLEKLVAERTKELIIAKEQAEESDKLKSAFLENMSHEIRTPMNAILGFINLLDNPQLEEKTRQYYINYINQSGKILLRLIDDIIDFARLEAGQIFIDKRRCSITDLVNEILPVYRKKISAEKPKITVLLESPDDEIISSTDGSRLKQIINHLLDNAMKFTNSGFIKLSYNIQAKSIRFEVEDSGIGISEKYLERIFDRFFKIENTETKQFKGAGLGLSLCKNLLNLLGGKISVISEPDKGSTFSFTIPYEPHEVISTAEKNRKPVNYTWDDKHILIAEDENTNYHFLEAVLKKTGAQLIRAENGIELLELFQKLDKIDIILLDIKMPGLDGLKALKLIRETSTEIPILAQTAYNSPSDRKRCLEMGCNDFIAKPIPQHLLLEKMDKLIRNFEKGKSE
ncbi:MAG: ATP-binding protein [Bacteroidales bacterium]|nr:ATP-binding protein [Bacteroidales bacterium]